jgi:hypothetical protein
MMLKKIIFSILVMVFLVQGFAFIWMLPSELSLRQIVVHCASPLCPYSDERLLYQLGFKNFEKLSDRYILKNPLPNGNLFYLNLKKIEALLMQDSVVASVRLEKRFSQAELGIVILYRSPVALWIHKNGQIQYVDSSGVVFGEYPHLGFNETFITLQGFDAHDGAGVKMGIDFIQSWKNQNTGFELLGLEWDSQKGFRGVIRYSMVGRTVRAMVNLSPEIRIAIQQLPKVFSVLQALIDKGIVAKSVTAVAQKKVFVKY